MKKPGDILSKSFEPLFNRLRELQTRFRPGEPFRWKEHHYTKRSMAARKADRRRKSKAARIARRQNRRVK